MISIERPMRFTLFLAICVILPIVVLGVWYAVIANAKILQNGEFTIEAGTASSRVWENAKAEGFIDSTLPPAFYAWKLNASSKLQSGTYVVNEGDSVKSMVERMAAGETIPDEISVTYPEGFTLKQVAERTAARDIGTEQEFLNVASPQNFAETFDFLSGIPAGRDLEGYLFPDTYHIFPDDTARNVILRMLTTFDQKATDELRAQATAQGRTLDDIVIMASIIEREVISDEDMGLVSGVLWKRYDEGIGLAADATVRYILDKWDEPLTVQDLAVDSPYNTRRYRGLPPGPISNPGIRALQAAANPVQSEYYYYLSAPSGETIFSRTNEEHNLNKAKYLR